MAKDRFEFARIGSPEEIVEYLTSLAVGLKRGEVSLESGERVMRLVPPSELRLEIRVQQKEQRGKLKIEIGWKRQTAAKISELRVQVRPRAERV
jgi:amphi-Trp domain-containing protein